MIERDESVEGLFGSRGRVFGRIVYGPAMEATIRAAAQAASSALPVLVTGESGVGKELIAEAIHGLSPRRQGQFVALNCGGLPRDLVESELFGHAKGAFTSAVSARAGAFVAAHGGTLFLDEIGELPLPTQSTLLRVLETGRVRPVGLELERPVDARVIAATNRDLDQLSEAGAFRADLVFRLDVLRVFVPPLRARVEDIRVLVPALLARHGCGARVTRNALEALERHHWPGNVRELRNVVIRAAQAAGSTIDRVHVDGALGRTRVTAPRRPMLRDSVLEYATEAFASSGQSAPRAAERLGIPRSTFYRWLKAGQARSLSADGPKLDS